jgi:DNA mismatch repair protein MSH6
MEVPVSQCGKVPGAWTSKSQKKTHRRYWTTDIEKKLAQLVKAETALADAQQDTMRIVFEKFDKARGIWRDALACVSILDAMLSLALVSSSPNYSWPSIRDRKSEDTDPTELKIEAGRHPMLEAIFAKNNDGEYIPNSVSLGGKVNATYNPKMMLLSGPNMGGKSTLLRQTCLIAIMAQLGMKVPADSVEMTPIDRIFTRVGASDRILAGQSTFYVELAETASILKQSTQDSLCILDELGRGTATFDGTAIAHSVVNHLVCHSRCRGLFATHYHSLVDDWKMDPRVVMGHMECVVDNSGGEKAANEEVTFLYHLAKGSSPRSYGINVARLAQLPMEVVELAMRQSEAFEQKLSRADGDLSSTGMSGTTKGALNAFYERMVSIANSNVPLPELVSIVKEMYVQFKSLS